MTTPDELAAIRRRWEGVTTYNRCANCGTLVENAKAVFVGGWMCDEEFVCSKSCHDQLLALGCPHETSDNYRPRPQEVLEHEIELHGRARRDIHTLRAALDASLRRNDDTDARLLVAVRALEDIGKGPLHRSGGLFAIRQQARNAVAEIGAMKAEQEARG